jgi:hypothetical protein
MTKNITTKYNIADEVWVYDSFIDDVKKIVICNVRYHEKAEQSHTWYEAMPDDNDNVWVYPEHCVFKTEG